MPPVEMGAYGKRHADDNKANAGTCEPRAEVPEPEDKQGDRYNDDQHNSCRVVS